MVGARRKTTLKFLCSYDGKILPRYPDGKLRYHGGHTRLLSVHRSISFSELLLKLGEICGTETAAVSLRCQLPREDLDALVSIKSDEDLANLIEEYDRASLPSLKIRAFLSSPKSARTVSPPSTATMIPRFPTPPGKPPRASCPRCLEKSTGKMMIPYVHGNPSYVYLIHHGNHWQ